MYYKLNQNIALRSWKIVPHAYYIYGNRNATGLKQEEWDLLCSCDSVTDIAPSSLLEELQSKGMCSPCKYGDQLDEWQKVAIAE